MIDEITRLRAAQAGLPAAESHPDAPLACFPLKIEWEMLHPQVEEAFPAPLIDSHSATLFGDPLPTPVLKLSEYAREHSWEVRAQYSQGYAPHGVTGKPGVLKDVLALRFGAHPMTGRQAYACYVRNASGGSWAWDGIMIWGPDLPPFAGCGLEHLKTFLADPSVADVVWVSQIRQYRAEQAEAAKARIKAAPKRNTSEEAS